MHLLYILQSQCISSKYDTTTTEWFKIKIHFYCYVMHQSSSIIWGRSACCQNKTRRCSVQFLCTTHLKLPEYLKSVPTLRSFKLRLKMFLFATAFFIKLHLELLIHILHCSVSFILPFNQIYSNLACLHLLFYCKAFKKWKILC